MDVSERLSHEEVAASTVTAAEHIHRYQLAAELIGGGRVLDLGCGVGYGSLILAEAGASVTAIDNDPQAIADARAGALPDASVTYEIADVTEFLRRTTPADFDAIVAFEVLEHIELVQETADALRILVAEGVKLIASVPNSKYFDEQNEFHLSNFDRDRAIEYFGSIGEHTLLEQHLAEGSWIGANEGDPPSTEFALRQNAEAIAAHHYIALFNLGETEIESARALLQMVVSPQHARYIRDLERSNRELWRTNSKLSRALFEQQGQTGGIYGSGAAAKLRKFENRVLEAEKRARIAEDDANAIKSSLTWRITHPFRGAMRRLKNRGTDE